ncbi:MAG: hypothetical protein ACRDJT_05900 [Actinomycetota bacterium]
MGTNKCPPGRGVQGLGNAELQLRFDEGRQQRYFSDRRDLLECVLRVGAQSPHPRFEVWGQGEPVLLADGREAGKRFELFEVLDLSEDGMRDRVADELRSLDEGVES